MTGIFNGNRRERTWCKNLKKKFCIVALGMWQIWVTERTSQWKLKRSWGSWKFPKNFEAKSRLVLANCLLMLEKCIIFFFKFICKYRVQIPFNFSSTRALTANILSQSKKKQVLFPEMSVKKKKELHSQTASFPLKYACILCEED